MVVYKEIDKENIIEAFILVLNPIFNLKNREIQLLKSMIKVYIYLKKIAKEKQIKENEIDEKFKSMLGKKIIMDDAKMSNNSFYNHIVQLKRKKVLNKDGTLIDKLKSINYSDDKITYILKLKETNVVNINKTETKTETKTKTENKTIVK